MEEISEKLKIALLVMQFLAALVGCLYFKRLKATYWKWFIIYLVIILVSEVFWNYLSYFSDNVRFLYYLYFGVPIEFFFLYWLYARKSLNQKKLYVLFTLFFAGVILFTFFIENPSTAISLVSNVGGFLLIILVVLEYFKQIRNDDILKFKENKMFYINLGVMLFYVGALPFHVFQKYLYQDYRVVVEYYYLYFLIANCVMYLLFAMSFIWGKEQS